MMKIPKIDSILKVSGSTSGWGSPPIGTLLRIVGPTNDVKLAFKRLGKLYTNWDVSWNYVTNDEHYLLENFWKMVICDKHISDEEMLSAR